MYTYIHYKIIGATKKCKNQPRSWPPQPALILQGTVRVMADLMSLFTRLLEVLFHVEEATPTLRQVLASTDRTYLLLFGMKEFWPLLTRLLEVLAQVEETSPILRQVVASRSRCLLVSLFTRLLEILSHPILGQVLAFTSNSLFLLGICVFWH